MNNENYGYFPYQDINLLNDMFIQNSLNEINTNGNYNYEKNITGSYEGYLKGNMFNNLYKEYKNYRPSKLIPNSEQSEAMLNIDEISFALNDIKLYLDIHPEDKNMINIYNKYSIQLNELINEYETKYGPIMCNTISNNNLFSWETYSFPWEMEEI